MPSPFDYSLNVPDPAQSMLQALKFRGALRDYELRQQAGAQNQIIRDQQIEQNRINFEQQNEQYDVKLEQQRAQRSLIESEEAQNTLFQEETEKFNKLPEKQQTLDEISRILSLLPGGMKKQMQDRYESLPKEQALQLQSNSGQFYAGLSGDKKSQDFTIEKMKELSDKYEEDGRPENVDYAKYLRAMIEAGPKASLLQLGAGLGAMPDGPKIIKAVNDAKTSRQKTAQAKVDLAAKNLSIGIKEIELNLAESKKSGKLDIEKKFIFEEKLRKEFTARTKLYNNLIPTFNNIKSSADAKNGPGDIALITSFMKMLDPASVVRETEFATARDTAGLYDRLINKLSNLEDGTLISLESSQRQQYVSLAKQYLKSSQKQAIREKDSLGIVSRNYGLNDDNVFGVFGQDDQQPQTQPQTGGFTQPSDVNRNITVDY